MAQTGMGVMIRELFGYGDSAKVFNAALNKEIKALSLSDDALHFVFTDGSKMKLRDDGQSCCEHRYLHTDDELQQFVGAKFTNAEVREAPNEPGDNWGGEHEVTFLIIFTTKGEFTIAAHNEHNGYYGGFAIIAEAE